MPKVAFRVDGNKQIGLGHLMRCISLGKAFSENGTEVIFITRISEENTFIINNGFEILNLPELINNNNVDSGGYFYGTRDILKDEATLVVNYIQEENIEILIVDMYNIDRDFFLSLKKHIKALVYIDDLNITDYPVDVLINGNITGHYLGYDKTSKSCLFLLGLKYNLIRDEFKSLDSKAINRDIQNVLITTGGADPFSITNQLIKIILNDSNLNKLNIQVIVTNMFKELNLLIEISKKHENIKLFTTSMITDENIIKKSSLVEVFRDADIAISSGGSTLYELLACGTPTLAFIVATNQEFIVKTMTKKKYIINLGWYNQILDSQFVQEIIKFKNDFILRQDMSKKGQSIVDGNGAKRASEEILKIYE